VTGEIVASITNVVRPRDLGEVLSILVNPSIDTRVLAGGTDLLLKYHQDPAPELTLVDITMAAGLSGVQAQDDGLRIFTATTLTEVMRDKAIQDFFPVLVEGAAELAGVQIRNLATLGGNICNASPSADTIPALLVAGAHAEVASTAGRRAVPLDEFFVGPGRTVLEPGELLEAVWLPWPDHRSATRYRKVSPRRAMDLAIVGVAVGMGFRDDGLRIRIGLGGVAPTPLRAKAAESVVSGSVGVDEALAFEAGRVAAEEVSPITDVRGSAPYRRAMVQRCVASLLLEVFERVPRR
jgi:CO/xanthine dehydrogenase FAD-binding subunit